MAGNVEDINDSNFDDVVLKASGAVIVDFWAPWCGPCKSIAPVLEELATQYAGKIKICKMNVDDNPRTPSKFNVRGIPNLVFFKGGKVVEQVVGAVPKEQLTDVINAKLA